MLIEQNDKYESDINNIYHTKIGPKLASLTSPLEIFSNVNNMSVQMGSLTIESFL